MNGSVGSNPSFAPLAIPSIRAKAAYSCDSSEHKVVHCYHDHANDPDGGYDFHPATGTEQSFPMRLHYMLNDIQQDNLSHIVSWMPHGRCEFVWNLLCLLASSIGEVTNSLLCLRSLCRLCSAQSKVVCGEDSELVGPRCIVVSLVCLPGIIHTLSLSFPS